MDEKLDKKAEKPNWWPDCPYPESVFPSGIDRYVELVPDPHARCGLSGVLGRQFWNIASESILQALQNRLIDVEVCIELREDEIICEIEVIGGLAQIVKNHIGDDVARRITELVKKIKDERKSNPNKI